MAVCPVTMVLWKETALPLCRAMERRWKRYVVIIIFFDPSTQFPRNEKITLCNAKKYKNQAGMNLTPPPPSQNSHAVRWHCVAESERRVAEIKS